MPRKPAWWQNPQTLIACVIGLGTIGGWIVSGFVADAKQGAKLELVEGAVAKHDVVLEAHEGELTQAELRQELIQKDIEAIQSMQQLILDEVKKRR